MQSAEKNIQKEYFKIAIDGYSASGKSSISKFLSKEFKIILVNSGNLYRSITAYIILNYEINHVIEGYSLYLEEEELQKAVNFKIKERRPVNFYELLAEIERFIVSNKKEKFDLQIKEDKYILNGQDISEFIRSPLNTKFTSLLSQIDQIRQFCNSLQKNIIKNNHVVIEGRDIGTVVMPDAQLKLFINCSAEERANRRHKEHPKEDYKDILEKIKERDHLDMNRQIAPLKKSEDAIEFFTENKTEDECCKEIRKIVENKMKELNFEFLIK